MDTSTERDRRNFLEQSLASTRLEGHIPSAEFLADCERFVRGEITQEELRAASAERALKAERAAISVAQARDAA